MRNCNHQFYYAPGKDTVDASSKPSERICTICGLCYLYSALKDEWIEMGYIEDHV